MAKIAISDLAINHEQETFLQELQDSELRGVKGGWSIVVRIAIKIILKK
jgi:hypothetical protein